MDEQLETFSVRVKDAAVSLAEKGLRRRPLFLAISHGQRFVELKMGPVTFEIRVDAEFDGVVGGG